MAPATTGSLDGVVVEGVEKSFGSVQALRGIDFQAAQGEVLGILGPNGAGKTTTVNILSTLIAPDAGRALVAGHDVVTEAAAVRRSIMLTGQFAALDDALSGYENLVMFGRLMGLRKRAARTRAAELGEEF
ncbi:ATP-binding cassette domain-containing protein, partial [Nocardia seriolae]|uniref:ATP-binding cassette domain-containing protein n=1 Tax=Nocardia seriolae TaxID=37332 RepID=UPI00132897EA